MHAPPPPATPTSTSTPTPPALSARALDIPNNVHLAGESDSTLDCNSAFNTAKHIFCKIVGPHVEFLPLGVEPPQANYGDTGSGSGGGGGSGGDMSGVTDEEAYIARALQEAQLVHDIQAAASTAPQAAAVAQAAPAEEEVISAE